MTIRSPSEIETSCDVSICDAVSLGLARTGKLVTSAALVLMFAFLVLSTGPGLDIKQLGEEGLLQTRGW